MARIVACDLYQVDLPLRKPFKHAAAERWVSNSLFLKCVTDRGVVGFGESLPRDYVTGETVTSALAMLRDQILPRLLQREFGSMQEVRDFLIECNGKAPADWVSPDQPQCAAWCAVDLALLDAFGRTWNEPVWPEAPSGDLSHVTYSGVLSAERKAKLIKNCLLFRLVGFKQVKLKVETHNAVDAARLAQRWLGPRVDLRVDANMAWDVDQAREAMVAMKAYGVHSFEQPLPVGQNEQMAELIRSTGQGVMVDESLNDAESLEKLLAMKACSAVNVRISKCGGLMAALQRCRRASQAGLDIQIGCQVGESSLLSAAHLALLAQVPEVRYAEGCFGEHLLRQDVVTPVLVFGYGGRPPQRPVGPGLGVAVDESRLLQYTVAQDHVGADS